MNKNSLPDTIDSTASNSTFSKPSDKIADRLSPLARSIAVAALQQNFDSPETRVLLGHAALLQVQSLVKGSDDIDALQEVHSSPSRVSDLAVVLAAMFGSPSAWLRLTDDLNEVRSFANQKYASQYGGSVVDEAIDGTIDQLRAEPDSRAHTPNFRVRLGLFRGVASLKTWLRTVAINRIVTAGKRASKLSASEIPENAAAPNASVELQHQVQQAIEKLSPPDQVFTRLLHIYGESQVDVAKLLKVSPAAVSQRRRKVLQTLRDLMDAEDMDAEGSDA